MKKRFSWFSFILILVLTFTLGVFVVGCDSCNKNNDENPTFALTLSQTNIDAIVGDTNKITVTNVSKDAKIEWTSSNDSVAIVNDGEIEAISEGTAKIKATYLTYTAECTVNVSFGNYIPKLIVKNAGNDFVIGRSQTSFPIEVAVLFNGKEYNDVKIKCSSKGDFISFDENGNMSPITAGSEEVAITATWRGCSIDRFPSLFTKIKVTVTDELHFWVNGSLYSNIELDALKEFDGVTYQNEMDFVVSGEFNGEKINAKDIKITCPEFVELKNDKITALVYGMGKIYLSCDIEGKTLSGSIDIKVNRIEYTFDTVLDYFSTNTGTYKDQNDGWANKSVINTVFNGMDSETYDLNNLEAYQGSKKLDIEGDKIFGLNVNYAREYNSAIRFETGRIVFNVDVVVYGLVIKDAEDLKNFELHILKEDDPETESINETEVTCVDGYCALINNIDARGVKISHPALKTIKPEHYMYATSSNDKISEGHISGKFGFIGNFDGRGNTIFNLDVSTEGSLGFGLFGYMFGNTTVENVGFKNLNCSNSVGLVRESISWGAHGRGTDPLGLRIGNPTWKNIYIHLSKDTINPQGALFNTGGVKRYNTLSCVIIDATEVKLNGAKKGGVFSAADSSICDTHRGKYSYSFSDVFVISPEIPAAYSTAIKLYGKNCAPSTDLLRLPAIKDGVRYSAEFYSYSSYEDLIKANHDFSKFNSSWLQYDYPVFNTSKDVLAEIDGNVKFDDSIILSSATEERVFKLTTLTNAEISDVEFVEYDKSKIIIEKQVDESAKIKLVNNVVESANAKVVISYKLNGNVGEIIVNVSIMPELIEISTPYQLSSTSMKDELNDLVGMGQSVISVTQNIDGFEPLVLALDEKGNMPTAMVVREEDYSDVKKSVLIVQTTDLVYKFTNVRIYTKVLRTGADLRIFEHTAATIEDIKGYYVLGNNIDATDVTVSHTSITSDKSSLAQTTYKFQGVLDGQGYSISNFAPTRLGLLKSVYSDTDENGGKSVIRNIAFLNVNGKNADKNYGYNVLGALILSRNGAQAEISNVHVEISKINLIAFPTTPDYRGLFSQADSVNAGQYMQYEGFKFNNVYVNIVQNSHNCDAVPRGDFFGALIGSDQALSKGGKGAGIGEEERKNSQRFENVVLISDKIQPSAWISLYNRYVFAYAENTIGENGKLYLAQRKDPNNENQYLTDPAHPVISDNPEAGSYIYYGVFKYDTTVEVPAEKISLFTETNLWEVINGELLWKSRLVTDDSIGDDDTGSGEITDDETVTVSVNGIKLDLEAENVFDINYGDLLIVSASNNVALTITEESDALNIYDNRIILAVKSRMSAQTVNVQVDENTVYTLKVNVGTFIDPNINDNVLVDFDELGYNAEISKIGYTNVYNDDGTIKRENGGKFTMFPSDDIDKSDVVKLTSVSNERTQYKIDFQKPLESNVYAIGLRLMSTELLNETINENSNKPVPDLRIQLRGYGDVANGDLIRVDITTANKWVDIVIPILSFGNVEVESYSIYFNVSKLKLYTLYVDEIRYFNTFEEAANPNVIASFDNTNYEYISSWTGGFNPAETKHNGYWPKVLGTTKDSTGGVLQLGTRANQSNLELWVKLYRSFKISESTATGIYFKVYTDYPLNAIESDFRVRLGSADRVYNGDSSYVHVSTTTTGAWTTIYVPFTSFTNIGADADVENTHLYLLLGKDWSNAGGNKVFYIDEIGFYNE